jgi:hypothetical protein
MLGLYEWWNCVMVHVGLKSHSQGSKNTTWSKRLQGSSVWVVETGICWAALQPSRDAAWMYFLCRSKLHLSAAHPPHALASCMTCCALGEYTVRKVGLQGLYSYQIAATLSSKYKSYPCKLKLIPPVVSICKCEESKFVLSLHFTF